MSIFVEPNELQSNSKLPPITGAITVPNLEEDTGADLMISPLDIPCSTLPLLMLHLQAGAIMVQRKSGHDIVSSLGDRLHESISRMKAIAPPGEYAPAQRRLLTTGVLLPGRNGVAMIDGKKCEFQNKPVDYLTVIETEDRWTERGGSQQRIASDSLIPSWCAKREHALKLYRLEPEKWSIPKPQYTDTAKVRDGLQATKKLSKSERFKRVLAGFDGMGVVRINQLWEACGADPSRCLQAMTTLSDTLRPDCIPLWLCKSLREQLLLPPDVDYIGPGYYPF